MEAWSTHKQRDVRVNIKVKANIILYELLFLIIYITLKIYE